MQYADASGCARGTSRATTASNKTSLSQRGRINEHDTILGISSIHRKVPSRTEGPGHHDGGPFRLLFQPAAAKQATPAPGLSGAYQGRTAGDPAAGMGGNPYGGGYSL